VSDGGLAVCLAEIALGANDGHGLGISAKIEHTDSVLFGEHPGYGVVGAQDVAAVHHLAQELGLESSNLGVVRAELGLELHNSSGKVVNWTHEVLRQAYEYSIPNAMRA
jgi:phosphoribosylformylglycinamidine (FGAM) synthase-like enzyme